MTTQPGSLERAIRAEVESRGIAGLETDPNQLDLLRGDNGKLPANVFQLVRQGQAHRGRGRPAGATNKRNQKLAQLICQEHGDPVLYMASIYSMPLDQLLEMLRLADNAAEREDRLYQLAETFEKEAATLAAKGTLSKAEAQHLDRLSDRLADIARVLRSTPGDLAIKALALQKQAAQEVAQYVHGKQPVSVNVTGKADMVLLVPGLNAPIMDPKALEDEIRARGLDAIDLENMQLIEGDATEIEQDDGE